MNRKHSKLSKQAMTIIAVVFTVTVFFSTLATSTSAAEATTNVESSEYQQFVHTYINSTKGNWTSVGKPMFPIYFNSSQIAIGSSWRITIPLVEWHNYHVYCYGEWVNNGSLPKTDYDVYVYDPRGILESEHTEAAGLPEHLGTFVNDTFFTPKTTGNYTFVVTNDLRQSNGTQSATFVAIENVQLDKWFTTTIEGKRPDGTSATDTAWAYEFVTDSPQIEVYINVPSTLDMYEARLYKMSSSDSLIINGAPLPWEPGLYGNLSGDVGGYNLNSDGYRGVAYASCECKGQDMQLNYNISVNTASKTTTTTKTNIKTPSAVSTIEPVKTLYQLVLVGEVGYGKVDFLVKTSFNDIALLPSNETKQLSQTVPGNETYITYSSNGTALTSAILQYTINQWDTKQEIPMKIDNRTCSATVPSQAAGTQVAYRVIVNDTLLNTLIAVGNYTVKQLTTLNVSSTHSPTYLGENITINGRIMGVTKNSSVQLQFMSPVETQEVTVLTASDGTFAAVFHPNCTGVWAVQASYAGDNKTFASYGNMLTVTVEEQPFFVKNGMVIGGGSFFGIVALGLVYYIKKHRQ